MCKPKNQKTLLTTPLTLSADYDHYQWRSWLKNTAQPPICNVTYMTVIRAGSLYPCFLAYRENCEKTMIERKYGTMYPPPPHCSFSGNGREGGNRLSYIYYGIGLWFGSQNNVLQLIWLWQQLRPQHEWLTSLSTSLTQGCPCPLPSCHRAWAEV